MKSRKIVKKSNENAITLVALVVTIVVLLILAGITIVYVFGDNGVFGQASQAKIQTELGKIEERAQMIYSDKLMETASSTLGTKVETSDVIEQLRNEGYVIKQRAVSADDIAGISLDKESMTIGKNKTAEIKVTYEGVEEPFVYYVEVQGKYYQMHSNKGFIAIDREASNLTKADFENENGEEGNTATLTVTSSDETVATASLKAGSNNTIEITSKEKEAEITITVTYGSYEKTCKVKVVEPVLATGITINPATIAVEQGTTGQLIATVMPKNVTNKTVTWTSSDETIATVSDTGIVIPTGKLGGEITITATTVDGSNKSATCQAIIETDWGVINEVAKAIAKMDSVTVDSSQVLVTVNGIDYTINVGGIYYAIWENASGVKEGKRVRVLGFKHDELVNKKIYNEEGDTTAEVEKASISFEFYDCMGSHNMNGTSSNNSTNANGWTATEMRTYLEGIEGIGKLSNKSYIKQVKKKYIKTYNDASSVTTSNDYLWLLSCSEVFRNGYTSGAYGLAVAKEGEQYLYYKNNAKESYDRSSPNRLKYVNGRNSYWWLRSPGARNKEYFCCLMGSHGSHSWSCDDYGVAPGFCI